MAMLVTTLALLSAVTLGPGGGEGNPKKDKKERFSHKGFVLDGGVGALGCVRQACRKSHGSKTGFQLKGFVGGNIGGLVEVGLGLGWGSLRTDIAQSTSVLDIYGIEGDFDQHADDLGIPLDDLNVDDAKLRSFHATPIVRVHFPRKGYVAGYVGAGFGYSLFRAKYDASTGEDFRIDFHGLEFPLQAGLWIYPIRRVAFGPYFDYRITTFLAAVIDHPRQLAGAPVGAIEDTLKSEGATFDPKLPHFWSAGAQVRVTLGRGR